MVNNRNRRFALPQPPAERPGADRAAAQAAPPAPRASQGWTATAHRGLMSYNRDQTDASAENILPAFASSIIRLYSDPARK